MNKKIAIFIVNYNMPEKTNDLVEQLKLDRYPKDIYVIDNGSDLVEPSPYTNIQLGGNIQTTQGWLTGWKGVKDWSEEEYFAYMFMITSAEIPKGQMNFIGSLMEIFEEDEDTVIVHPVLTRDSTTQWKHMITRNTSKNRRTWMVDNIAALYRADWFNENPFDHNLVYGWGIDLEAGWKARTQGKHIWICEHSFIKKVTNIGYYMNRMRMTAAQRQKYASENAEEVLSKKYGENWRDKLLFEERFEHEIG